MGIILSTLRPQGGILEINSKEQDLPTPLSVRSVLAITITAPKKNPAEALGETSPIL